jgi:phospholipid/cholesterol/gamma-HCH transport system permease protein
MIKKILEYIFFPVGDICLLFWRVLISCFTKFPSWTLLQNQLYDIGVLSFLVVAITGFSTGSVLATQSFYQLADKGLAGATGIMVSKSMIIELGPVLTAFMVTGRIGAAICAEIGSMKVTEQLDALRTMRIHPFYYLVTPRFIAGIFMVPILTIFCIISGILGGYLIAIFVFNMPPIDYFSPLPDQITYFDIASGLIKSFCFGLLIITIACYKGLKTEGGAQGVGKSTTNSVVLTYVCILFCNFFLTIGMYSLTQII